MNSNSFVVLNNIELGFDVDLSHPVMRDLAVVRRLQTYLGRSYVRLDMRFVEAVTDVAVVAGIGMRALNPMLRLLDAYASLLMCDFYVDAELGILPLGAVNEFFGALYSRHFYSADNNYRHRYAGTWRKLCLSASAGGIKQKHASLPEIRLDSVTDEVAVLVEQFESQPINRMHYEFWRGWPLCSSDNGITWIDLRGVYAQYGAEFCASLYRRLSSYSRGRVKASFTWLQCLLEYFVSKQWSADAFVSTRFTKEFLSQFRLYMVTVLQHRMPYLRIVTTWNTFSVFAYRHLLDGALFAKLPENEIPKLPHTEVKGSAPHTSRNPDGDEFISKCLTPLPIELTNEQALSVIFDRISADVQLVERWATAEADKLWAANQRRIETATDGQVRHVNFKLPADGRSKRASDSNFDRRVIHASATYEHYKFRTEDEVRLTSAFGKGHSKVSVALGLPTIRALLPHMCLLVIDHNEITPSFLEKLLVGDVYSRDGKWFLRGEKSRKGPELSEQVVALSSRSAAVIRQAIRITADVREYLKKKGDPMWEFLFLHTGRGFGYPRRYDISSQTANASSVYLLEKSFRESGLPFADARAFAEGFSLPALRCSVATAKFIAKPSLIDLSKRLGHTRFNPELARLYLPQVIERFFQQRWTRVFQTGLLVVALKESPHLLKATGLSDGQALNTFLANHALSIKPRGVDAGLARKEDTKSTGEVVFGISEQSLTVLLSVRKAVEEASGQVALPMLWWAQYAERLETYIETSAQREDFVEMLRCARQEANSRLVEDALYA